MDYFQSFKILLFLTASLLYIKTKYVLVQITNSRMENPFPEDVIKKRSMMEQSTIFKRLGISTGKDQPSWTLPPINVPENYSAGGVSTGKGQQSWTLFPINVSNNNNTIFGKEPEEYMGNWFKKQIALKHIVIVIQF